MKNAIWFYRTRDEFSIWKRAVWVLFGKRIVGEKHGCRVIGYELSGITMVWRIESEDPYWRYPK